MAGDDWTVVGSRGRPRKPRQKPGSVSDRSGGSPAAGTRGTRRSAQAAEGDTAAEGQQNQGAEPPEPLPGWGSSNGHGSGAKGRAGRAKRRQAWVERSPAERVESLKRSVLEAKRDVQASAFYAALMAALHTSSGNSDDEAQAAGAGDRTPNGVRGDGAGSSASDPAAGSQKQRRHPQEQLAPESSGGSGSMAVDQASGSCPMATDSAGSPQRDTATNSQLQNGPAAAHHAAGECPNSHAAAAKPHLPEATQQAAATAQQHKAAASQQRRWRWADVQELVAYGLGSFESGPVPRCQLALTLLLAEAAGHRLAAPPQLYDPAFTEVDKLLLREMGCALIARNEHGRRQFGGSCCMPASNGHSDAAADRLAASPTAVPASAADNSGGSGCALVYLAHCKPELCNALLDANWTPAQLASFAIIGNSMYTCEETWAVKSMRQVFASRPSRTLALARARAVAETGIPESDFPVTGAFNDVAFHIVTAPGVAAAPDADCDSE